MNEAFGRMLFSAVSDGFLPWEVESSFGREFGLTAREVEAEALEAGIRLQRYVRNFRTIDGQGQLKLHRSRVVVAGCGGLGGFVVEELARLGVGTLVVVDPDVFDASNLNRQLFATLADLGVAKVDAAVSRVAAINPATLVEARPVRLGSDNAASLVEGADVAADALDSIPARLVLEDACGHLGLALVHGAIAGHYVQATTSLPGSGTLRRLFGVGGPERGIETELGNPAFTPAVAASIQAAEIVRILLGRAPALAGILFHLDLERMEAVRLPLD